jgi:hypothetical protein
MRVVEIEEERSRSCDRVQGRMETLCFFDRKSIFAIAILLKSGIIRANQGRKRRFHV